MFDSSIFQTYELIQEQIKRARESNIKIKVRRISNIESQRSYYNSASGLHILIFLVSLLGRWLLGVSIHVFQDQKLRREARDTGDSASLCVSSLLGLEGAY